MTVFWGFVLDRTNATSKTLRLCYDYYYCDYYECDMFYDFIIGQLNVLTLALKTIILLTIMHYVI